MIPHPRYGDGMYRALNPTRFAAQLAPRLLSAPGELLLDTLRPLPNGARLLELCAGTGLLTRSLAERARAVQGQLVALDEDPLLLRALRTDSVRSAAGDLSRLPFGEKEFDAIIGNGALGSLSTAPGRLKELYRVLKPGGALYLSSPLAGAFQEFFDLMLEVCEQTQEHELRGRLVDGQSDLPKESDLRDLFPRAKLKLRHVGVFEFGLFFESGDALTRDPLLNEVLLPTILPHGPALSSSTQRRLSRAIDLYFQGLPFCLTVRTGLLRARRSRKSL